MKLATFRADDAVRIGVVDVEGGRIRDLSESAPDLPRTMVGLLEAGPEALHAAGTTNADRGWRSLDDVQLLAPMPRPPKFLAIGLNYRDHIEETGRTAPEFPVFFTKQVTCVIGPGEGIVKPDVSDLVDYEGELGVVIGRRCRHVAAERALDVVAGYTIVNDVTVRDWQMKAPTMMIGKSFDTHGPTGPWIVTTDEITDPHDLRIRTFVNDEKMQDASTGGMIFDIGAQIATLTTAMTLEPGDVLATGTPAGVGIARQPMRMLAAGDTVRVEIDGIGALENPVVAEGPRDA